MKKITKSTVKKMRGTEFTYIRRNGRTNKCFVAEVDVEVGMTLKALHIKPEPTGTAGRKKDEVWCLDIPMMSQFNSVPKEQLVKAMVGDLNEIASTGKLKEANALKRFFGGDMRLAEMSGGGGNACAF